MFFEKLKYASVNKGILAEILKKKKSLLYVQNQLSICSLIQF